MRIGANERPYSRGLVLGGAPKFLWEIRLPSAFIRNVSYPIGKAGWTLDQQLRFGPARAQESFGQGIGNECARSDSGSKVTLRMKFLEGEVDRESRDSQISGKRARRGKTGGVIVKTPRG